VVSVDPPEDGDLLLTNSLFNRTPETQPITWEYDGFLTQIQNRYLVDKFFSLVLEKPTEYKGFTLENGIIWHVNPKGEKVVCVPCNHETIVQILNQAHTALGHFGAQCTTKYVR
jgi:hypothetical protein